MRFPRYWHMARPGQHLTCTSVAARHWHWQDASNLPGPAAPYSDVQWARVRGDASKGGAGAHGASASQPERLGGALRPSSSTTATCRSATCHPLATRSPAGNSESSRQSALRPVVHRVKTSKTSGSSVRSCRRRRVDSKLNPHFPVRLCARVQYACTLVGLPHRFAARVSHHASGRAQHPFTPYLRL